jgi:ATPase family protein associated with various cellular activities (AAA)
MDMTLAQALPVTVLTPGLAVGDPQAAWWLHQVALRLRREVAWCWHQRGESPQREGGVLPPAGDPVTESLNLTRYAEDKRRFFAGDVTARYLTEQLLAREFPSRDAVRRGGWSWMARELQLDEAAQFAAALALAARLDAAIGPVCAACHNDLARPFPTLALAQRLWDDPLAVTACADPAHPLFRFGLIGGGAGREGGDWRQPLEMPAGMARALCTPAERNLPRSSSPLRIPPEAEPVVAWLAAAPPAAMQTVPLIGPPGADFEALALALAAATGRGLRTAAMGLETERANLLPFAAECWLRAEDILLNEGWNDIAAPHSEPWYIPVSAVPVRWYLPLHGPGAGLPAAMTAPPLFLPPLGFCERVERLKAGLGPRANGLDSAIGEVARRFRFQGGTLDRVAKAVSSLPGKPTAQHLFAACRAEAAGGMGHLAQAVEPRFALSEVVLPGPQSTQLAEIATAMRSLTVVHYDWGTGRAWNESGLAVLFCGPPGTGKTMAAEALAAELALPLYRIDLSQIVNKYIGETEKNLKRIFDAAEAADGVLFFDEADALFGKRTEVKDAHDRFANIEISYLLERMERFKGLAILATNRRRDLDEAFMRRLRYAVEFPMPGEAERLKIWRQVFPEGVDVSDLDFPYLAAQFELSGGHIRSIAFNACLQCAGEQPVRSVPRKRVSLASVLMAVKRELEKLNRVVGPEQFGRYAHLMEGSA